MMSARTAAALVGALVIAGTAAVTNGSLPLHAQETKPVPKDSVRVLVRGCTKGYVFTAGPRLESEPTTADIREGMHLRMNGPKKVMAEIKAHEGSMVELVGLMKKGQYLDGVNIGGGVHISGAPAGGGLPNPAAGQPQIDIESWRPVAGGCRTS
jgi:hypothetical protein